MSDLIEPTRRGFLAGLTGLLVAPAIVRVTSIMPVHSFEPAWSEPILHYDILTDSVLSHSERQILINGVWVRQFMQKRISSLDFMEMPGFTKTRVLTGLRK